MRLLAFIPLTFLLACAQTPHKPNNPKPVEVRITQQDIQECKEYQKKVLDRAFREVKSFDRTEIVFTKDVKEARQVLAQFDINRGLVQQRVQLVKNILHECDPEALKTFDKTYKMMGSCSLMFSELNYFQSLIAALNKYSWPLDLKLEGKKVALDYVEYFSQGDFPLLNRLIALSVLDELSVSGMVNKDLHSEIKQLMEESRNYVEGLRLKLNKDPGLSCQSLDIIKEELEYSHQTGLRMRDFLKRI